ncbi:MAG: histidinol-phosphate aminotransferase family protein [Caldilineaceae bacterium]|nr:histidinol-phosphate aminotransferase family protein [Caldilineaceae bacterium]
MTTLVPHGTLDYAELAGLGFQPEELVVFSSNINPHGPPPAVVTAVQHALTGELIARYPDRLSLTVRRALAEHHGLAEDAILVGNGTADLLWLLALLYGTEQRVAVVEPTFGEYVNAATLVGAQIERVCHPGWQMPAPGIYRPGPTTIADTQAALAKLAPKVVFICNPNNPTGHYLSPAELHLLYQGAPDALWVVDEAYAEFTAAPWSAMPWIEQGQWLILRSMTKDFALGGLRLGYAIAAPAIIARLQQAQSPWNVNAVAQVAGEMALTQLAWREKTLAQLRQDGATLRTALRQQGFHPLATTTNYFLLPVMDPTHTRAVLLQERLMVRDCTSFGLPDYIRIATHLPAQNALLVDALARHVKRVPPPRPGV